MEPGSHRRCGLKKPASDLGIPEKSETVMVKCNSKQINLIYIEQVIYWEQLIHASISKCGLNG